MTAGYDAVGGRAQHQVAVVRRWLRSGCLEPGTHLPALAEIRVEVNLSVPAIRRALEQLAAEGEVTLHEGYRLYSVGTVHPVERAYQLIRTSIHRRYEPGGRFMVRSKVPTAFGIGVREASEAVRRLVAEGVLTGPGGRYVADDPHRRARDLRARAHELRRQALALVQAANEIEDGVRPADPVAPDRDR